MFNSEKKQLENLLLELKGLGAAAVKAEFEEEAAEYHEAEILRNLAYKTGLKFELKLGGVSAYSDIKKAEKLDTDIITAPMTESCYAVKKFLNGIELYSHEKKELFIVIESVNGFASLNDIIFSPEFEKIDGIVFGRTDFGRALGANNDFPETRDCLEVAKVICQKCGMKSKKTIIGGGMNPQSAAFLRSLDYPSFSGFETRKILFSKAALENSSAAISKAIEFEISWLKYKGNNQERIKKLQKRLNLSTVQKI